MTTPATKMYTTSDPRKNKTTYTGECIMKLPHKLPGITREELLLASAWAAIEEDNSKAIHLEPRQAEALIAENRRLKQHIDYLAEKLADMSPANEFEYRRGWLDR